MGGGGELFVRESGDGETVLLIHAFPVDSRLYAHQLAAPFAGFRLLAPDLPGFGQTPPRPVRSLDDYASALLSVVGEGRFVCAGTSMGGYIAFAILRRAPERVRALVLAGTRAGPDTPEGRAAREETARRVETEGVEPVLEELLPRLLGPSAPAEAVEAVRRMGREATPEGMAAALRAMAARPDSSDTLRAARVPTLVVVGAEDAVTPPREAEAMAALVPGARLEVIPAAGHLACLEAPEAFNAALGGFLEALRR